LPSSIHAVIAPDNHVRQIILIPLGPFDHPCGTTRYLCSSLYIFVPTAFIHLY